MHTQSHLIGEGLSCHLSTIVTGHTFLCLSSIVGQNACSTCQKNEHFHQLLARCSNWPEIVFFEGVQLWVISDRKQQSGQGTQEGEDIPNRKQEERRLAIWVLEKEKRIFIHAHCFLECSTHQLETTIIVGLQNYCRRHRACTRATTHIQYTLGNIHSRDLGLAASLPPCRRVPNCPRGWRRLMLLLPMKFWARLMMVDIRLCCKSENKCHSYIVTIIVGG